MMKTLYAFLIAAIILPSGRASAAGWQWLRGAEQGVAHITSSSSHAWPVATDASGNVYVALSSGFDSLVIGSASYHSAIYRNSAILIKYDNAGNIIWSRGSSNGNSKPIDIAVDANGNAFLYGYFTGDSIRFGSTLITRAPATQATAKSCYVIKFGPDGEVQWKVNSGTANVGSEKQSYGGITVDDQGNAYVATTFSGTSQIGTYNFYSSGYDDISVAKYGPVGGLLWAKRFGGAGSDRVSDIAAGSDGRVYLTGEFSSPSISFGSLSLTYAASYPALSEFCYNVYLTAFNSDGSTSWVRQSSGNARAMSIAVDTTNDVYIGGTIRDESVNFGGGAISLNKNNPFFAKYSSGGDFIRTQVFTQSIPTEKTNCAVWGLTVDACNNIWVSGGMDTSFGNGIYLDTALVLPVPQAGMDPIFLASYAPDGSYSESNVLRSGGGSNSGVAGDRNGNIYLCGYYDAVEIFRVGDDSLNSPVNALKNFFVAKYSPGNNCIASDVPAITTALQTISIYPNPAMGLLNIFAPSSIGKLVITDILGKTVYTGDFTGTSAAIPVQGFAPGVYAIRMGAHPIRKFVKQ